MSVENIEVKPFYNLLDYIFRRPSVFQIESVSCLYKFYRGYEFALKTNTILDADLDHFQGFERFVKNKYGVNSSHDWKSIIMFYSSSNSDSINVFKTLLAEYRLG